jgi:nicotinamide riboside transporter PnuC
MKNFRAGVIIVAMIVIVVDLTFINYSDLSWESNMGPFCVEIAMILVIISQVPMIREDKKRKKLSE